MSKGCVFNTQRFSIHDGTGIRTVIFLKGCPLRCLWCANPESQSASRELEYIKVRCKGCGWCVKTCQNSALSFGKDGVIIDRNVCQRCGECASECYSRALKLMGEDMTVEQVFEKIAADEVFYKNSGGGYTLSGGEPLAQIDFCLELVEYCSNAGIDGAIETSGYGDTEKFKKLCAGLDQVFVDIKHMDSETHRELTGVSNELILKNIKEIQETAKQVTIRVPVIPGLNDDEENIIATARFCAELEKVTLLELLPFHRLGEHKYDALNKENVMIGVEPPSKEQMQNLREKADEILKKVGKTCKVNTSSTG